MTKLYMGLKMDEEIFLDTAFFKALVDIHDAFHERAENIWQRIQMEGTKLVTTNFILDETLTLLRVRCGLSAALDFRERLASGLNKLRIVRVLIRDEREAWEWFVLEWRHLSFTDCVSFAVMKRLGIEKVATFDEHFKKAGLETVH